MAQRVKTTCNPGEPGSISRSGKSLEKGMANHSSILAWRSPWTKEPGGLQSMGSQRVGHDGVINTQKQIQTHLSIYLFLLVLLL